MFQKGTGERFKYKEAVKKLFPQALCKRSNQDGYWGGENRRYTFAVWNGANIIGDAFYTAENAWADVWCKHKNEIDKLEDK